MKKALTILLVMLTVMSMISCKPQEDPGLTIDLPTSVEGTDDPASQATDALASPSPTIDLSQEVYDGMTPPPVVSATVDPNATPKPTPAPSDDPGTQISDVKDYDAAVAINKEVIGWIKVPNTNISYPIMYNDNHTKKGGSWYYHDHDLYKNKSSSGSIYSYYDRLTRNVVITGHNMRKSGTMFHELHKVQDNKSLLKTKDNRIFNIRIFGFRKWEVFALYETKDDEPESTLKYNTQHLVPTSGTNVQQVEEWIAYQKSRSEIKSIVDVDVKGDDYLLTLVTCGDDHDYSTAQSRLYIFLRGVVS